MKRSKMLARIKELGGDTDENLLVVAIEKWTDIHRYVIWKLTLFRAARWAAGGPAFIEGHGIDNTTCALCEKYHKALCYATCPARISHSCCNYAYSNAAEAVIARDYKAFRKAQAEVLGVLQELLKAERNRLFGERLKESLSRSYGAFSCWHTDGASWPMSTFVPLRGGRVRYQRLPLAGHKKEDTKTFDDYAASCHGRLGTACHIRPLTEGSSYSCNPTACKDWQEIRDKRERAEAEAERNKKAIKSAFERRYNKQSKEKMDAAKTFEEFASGCTVQHTLRCMVQLSHIPGLFFQPCKESACKWWPEHLIKLERERNGKELQEIILGISVVRDTIDRYEAKRIMSEGMSATLGYWTQALRSLETRLEALMEDADAE